MLMTWCHGELILHSQPRRRQLDQEVICAGLPAKCTLMSQTPGEPLRAGALDRSHSLRALQRKATRCVCAHDLFQSNGKELEKPL